MKTNRKIFVILIWQGILFLLLMSVLIWRIIYFGLTEPMPVSTFDYSFVYGTDISKVRLDTVIGNVMYFYVVVLVILIVTGYIGLILRKNWGRRLNILSNGMMSLFILWGAWLIYYYPIEDILIDLILPIIFILVIAFGCFLSILYISKPQAKVLFT